MEKIPIGVSSCLLGNKVRYDGGHKHDQYITGTLGLFFQWVPVCPEVECGLPTPREAMRLIDSNRGPRLVTRKTGLDHTDMMSSWASQKLNELREHDLCGFIFKSRSPSSGMERVKLYNSQSGMPVGTASGIFAAAFMENFPQIPVEEEGRLHDPVLRENFIDRVFTLRRWRSASRAPLNAKALIDFHTDHKMQLLSHSVEKYRALGRLVAEAWKSTLQELYNNYEELLMQALKLKATNAKNTNVLQHILGHFKEDLDKFEKQEILRIIEEYRKGLLPLIVPVTMLNHFASKYKKEYLLRQTYLQPHPVELKLRNHS